MAATSIADVDARPVEARRTPRSKVSHTFGPRGQLLPKVTIVTGEPDEFVDELVLAACARIDRDLHRLELERAGGVLGAARRP
jgi:hypothetical protein